MRNRLVAGIGAFCVTLYLAGTHFRTSRTLLTHTLSAGRTTPELALTFDDGPHPRFTPAIMAILKKHKIPATFFFVGQNIEMFRSTAQAVVDSGFEIGNHSFTHQPFDKLTPFQLYGELDHTDHLIRLLGYRGPIFLRPPFGQVSVGMTKLSRDRNIPIVLYSAIPNPPDYFRSDPDKMFEDLISKIKNGSIILLHDGGGQRTEVVALLDRLIPELHRRGFKFAPLSKFL